MLGFCGGGEAGTRNGCGAFPQSAPPQVSLLNPEAKEARSRRVMLTGGVPGYSVRAGGTRACCVRGEVP